ncbi:hypothetical protein [Flavobacterium chilense]|uniref:Uncharacterized protein n=1 Tax=Flavobacterium chilense TaxID=946677 RepID=A0A1M7HUS3_9FLAO|nr:hypothetical protein [Flavobacterium chilense]SHM32093.1 hypothetical protein SAMN05444484_105133 [Flavobacterium chilense]
MEKENEDFKILTDYILSINLWGDFNSDLDLTDFDLIEDWAIQLINLGCENEALYNLATFYKPINPDEIMPYLKRTFLELNLKEKEGDDAEICYARYHFNRVIKGEDVKSNLFRAAIFSDGNDRKSHPETELNFGVLSEIWLDMKYDPDYWYRGINISNIEQKVIEKAKWWLKNNPIN